MVVKKRKGKGKVVDKWKMKKWYTVYSPKVFEMKEVGEIVSSDSKNLLHRIIPISLSQIIGKKSQQTLFTTINLRINEVKGERAYSHVIGISVSNSYIRTFARKGHSTLDLIYKAKLKDNVEVAVKVFVVTFARVSENTKRNIRESIRGYIDSYAKEHGYDDIVNDLVYEKFVSDLYAKLKKITGLKRVEVKKMELVEIFE